MYLIVMMVNLKFTRTQIIGLNKIKSDSNMDSMYTSKLYNLQKAHTKVLKEKEKEKKGIAKYLVEDDDSDSNGSDNSDDGHDDLSGGQYLGAKSIMQTEDHPSKLIDLELLNVLKFCQDLYQGYKENNDDYQEEIMMKSIELGKKNK